MNRIRIAHITWSLGTGGIEAMLVDIINEQVKTADVCLCIINSVYNKSVLSSIDKRVSVLYCKRKPESLSVFPIVRLNYRLWKYRPDIIHYHHDKTRRLVFVPGLKLRTIHNTHSNPKYLKGFKFIFCISEGVKRYLEHCGNRNGVVVYNGIHAHNILYKTKGDCSNSAKRFVCVGRLHPDKGQCLIIEAFNILINNRHIGNISIDLIGEGQSRSVLESKIRKYQLDNYINLLGSKPREFLYPRLCEYDLFILPSISEGFGLSLAEACAAKIPVITCDLDGPLEVIDGGRLGRVFKSGDFCSLADQIEDFLKKGRDEVKIEEAYRFVLNNFDVVKTAQLYIEYYKKAING